MGNRQELNGIAENPTDDGSMKRSNSPTKDGSKRLSFLGSTHTSEDITSIPRLTLANRGAEFTRKGSDVKKSDQEGMPQPSTNQPLPQQEGMLYQIATLPYL